jgi:hypothetical protein
VALNTITLPPTLLLSGLYGCLLVICAEIRLNADGFHRPHHLTFSYAICGHVDTYNQVHSQEGYRIDYFPPFPAHLI